MIVELADEGPNGLASMMGKLIATNLEQHPERKRLLRPATIRISAVDIGLRITLKIEADRVAIANGGGARPEIRVRSDTTTLVELSAAPLLLGFPNVLTHPGRAVVAKLVTRRLRVRGLLRHPLKVTRLNRLLSVS